MRSATHPATPWATLVTVLVLLAVLALGAVIKADAATYIVAPPPAGDDSNPGTLAEPWATLQHAADTVQPGDVVQVRTGQYAGAQLTTSGTAALPIVVQAFPGETPEVVTDNASTPDGIPRSCA